MTPYSLVPHRWPGAPLIATMIERPNRFLAVCRLGGGTVRAHVPDRGRCLDLLAAGQRVVLVRAQGPLRTTAYTAVAAEARSAPGVWVSLDPGGAPRLVELALARDLLPSLMGERVDRREVAARHRALEGRIDLRLAPSGALCEVKSVGAARDGVALFPDAPTTRGLRHLRLLAGHARRGLPAAIVFCAQRGDVRAVAADTDIDPDFARTLRRARDAGVRLCALRCSASPEGLRLEGEIPVLL